MGAGADLLASGRRTGYLLGQAQPLQRALPRDQRLALSRSDTGPSAQAVNGFFAGMAALAGGSDEVFTQRRILAFAEQYAKGHWDVSEARAHLSLTEHGTRCPGDGDNSYLVCLDMPGVGDIERMVVVVNEHGTLERDHTSTDDAGCSACTYGKVREYLPAE